MHDAEFVPHLVQIRIMLFLELIDLFVLLAVQVVQIYLQLLGS